MNNKKNYKKGTRLDIIKTLHMTAVIPSKAFAVLDTPRTYEDKIREMEKENILTSSRVKNEGHTYRIITIKDYEKNRDQYKDFLPDGYYEIFITANQQAARECRNKTGTTSMRIITGAETYILLKNAGVNCDIDTKPNLLRQELFDDRGNLFYTSKEIKVYTGYRDDIKMIKAKNGIGSEEKLVLSSKITGVLVSDGGVYAVYNLGRVITNWHRAGELKIRTHIDYLLGDKMSNPYPCESALIMLEDYISLSRVITPLNKNDRTSEAGFENLKIAYNRIYAIPYSLDGRHMLEIMMKPNWINDMKNIFLSRFERKDAEEQGILCDAYTDKEYILLFCIPDLKRLQTFKKYAEADGNKEKFIVLCFDFQGEMVAKSCGKYCRIQKTSFDNFYNKFITEKE